MPLQWSFDWLARRTAVGISAVTLLSLGAMVFVAASLLGPSEDPFSAQVSSVVSLVVGWLILVSVALGLAYLATERTTARRPQPRLRLRRLGSRAVRVATAGLSLLPLVVAVLMDVPTGAGVDLGPVGPAFRAYLWCALAVSLVMVGRAQSGPSRPVRALQFCAPNVLLLLGSGLVLLASRSVRVGVLVVSDPLAALGFVGLVAVPAVLVFTAVEGLRDVRHWAEQLSAAVEQRPRLTVVVLAVKSAMILALISLDQWLRPDWTWLVSSVPIWLGAVGIGAFMISFFVLDNRIHVNRSDHGQVSRVLGALVALTLGSLAVWALSVALLNRPLAAVAVALLLGAGWLCRHRIRTTSPRVSCLVAALLGAGLSFASAIPWPAAWSVSLPTSPANLSWVQLGIFLAVTVSLCTIGLILMALLTKNGRLLMYFAAVVLWIVLILAVYRYAPELSLLNLDIVMLVLVTVAAVTWLAQRQTEIDGFEIVALVVITATVWELPLALQMVSPHVGTWILLAAAVSPGAILLILEVRRLLASVSARPNWRLLGTICLLYALLSALVWTVGIDGASVLDDLGSLLEAYLLVPLALLLLISASGAHVRIRPE